MLGPALEMSGKKAKRKITRCNMAADAPPSLVRTTMALCALLIKSVPWRRSDRFDKANPARFQKILNIRLG